MSPDDPSDAPTLPMAGASDELPPGATLGRYVILERVGAGGMGVVYAAYDPQLDRRVAVKLLRDADGAGREGRRARLWREAQALARLSHPNVVPVHDAGLHRGHVFIAMDFVAGLTLGRWVSERKPGWRETLQLFLRAGEGLAAAHAAAVVHRDFKPDNVLVRGDGHVFVTDFGLAQVAGELPPAVAEGAPAADSLTSTGMIMGTPAYMAPEQHQGRPTDERSDQFSFCVALYEALFGELPFAAEPSQSLGRADAHALEVIAGRVRPAPRGSDVPGWLRRVLVRGLAPLPEERYPSIVSLLHALRADPSRRWWRVAGGAVVAALLGGALLGGFALAHRTATTCRGMDRPLAGSWNDARRTELRTAFQATRVPDAEAAARRVVAVLDGWTVDWVQQRVDACEATRVRGEQSEQVLDRRMSCLAQKRLQLEALVDLYTHADDKVVRHAVAAAEWLAPPGECSDAAALAAILPPPRREDAPRVERLRAHLAQVHALELASKAREAVPLAAGAIVEATAIGYAPALADAHYELALLERDLGEYARAEAHLLETVYGSVALHYDDRVVPALNQLVFTVGYQEGRFDEARRWGRQAEALLALRPRDDANRADLLADLATVDFAQGRYAESLEGQRAALALRERIHGPNHPAVAYSLTNIAFLLYRQGRLAEAEPYDRRALAILERREGRNEDVAMVLNNLAGLLQDEGKLEEALDLQGQALAIRKAVLGPGHPDLVMSYLNLGGLHTTLGKLDEAEAELEHAAQLVTETLGDKHPLASSVGIFVGELRARQGRPKDALAACQRAVASLERALGPDHPDLARPLECLAEAALALHEPERALAFANRSIALHEREHALPSAYAAARFLAARAQWDLGQKEQGRLEARAAYDALAEAPTVDRQHLEEIDLWLRGR